MSVIATDDIVRATRKSMEDTMLTSAIEDIVNVTDDIIEAKRRLETARGNHLRVKSDLSMAERELTKAEDDLPHIVQRLVSIQEDMLASQEAFAFACIKLSEGEIECERAGKRVAEVENDMREAQRELSEADAEFHSCMLTQTTGVHIVRDGSKVVQAKQGMLIVEIVMEAALRGRAATEKELVCLEKRKSNIHQEILTCNGAIGQIKFTVSGGALRVAAAKQRVARAKEAFVGVRQGMVEAEKYLVCLDIRMVDANQNLATVHANQAHVETMFN